MPVKPVDMEKFISNVENLYEAIVITSRRARQLHEEVKIEFRQRTETLQQLTTTTSDVDDDMDTAVNPDQLKISLEFEKLPKPTDVALDELQTDKLQWRYKEVEDKTKEKPAE